MEGIPRIFSMPIFDTHSLLASSTLTNAPGTGHWISPAKVQLAIEFLRRHGTPGPGAAAG